MVERRLAQRRLCSLFSIHRSRYCNDSYSQSIFLHLYSFFVVVIIKVEPTFKMDDEFVIDVLQYVFGLDALESSRPINHPATSRAVINQNYDTTSLTRKELVEFEW